MHPEHSVDDLSNEVPLHTEERTLHGDISLYGLDLSTGEEGPVELRPTLLLLGGTNSGQIFRLEVGRNLIGRDGTARIALDSARISRRHCEILVEPDGQARVRELGSTNGTRLNGERLRPEAGYVPLPSSARLELGGSLTLKFGMHRLDEVRHHQTLYESAHCDALTGAYNKRHLLTRLHEEFSWAERQQRPLSILVFDLDHFKSVNDTYGHAVGDVVLKRVASVVRQQLRREDIFGRYGGEEFVILMRDTPLRWSEVVAERVRTAVARSPITYREGVVWATTSVGFASTEERNTSSAEGLFSLADGRLYSAKADGRNRCWGPHGLVRAMAVPTE